MTLIVGVLGRETAWLVADRRLSFQNAPPRDDARKIALIEGTDGAAILGYAGLGKTAHGSEPGAWMAAAVRGYRGTVEELLGVIANAALAELPRHLRAMPEGFSKHTTIIPAMVGDEPRFYEIHANLPDARDEVQVTWTRPTYLINGVHRHPKLMACGSGAQRVFRVKGFHRPIFRLIKQYEKGRIGAHIVADALAALNSRVAQGDRSVGPSSIVAWRNSKTRGPIFGGGGHQFYEGLERVNSLALPTVAMGMPVDAIAELTMRHVLSMAQANAKGEPPAFDERALDDALARLPTKPDPRLK